MLMVFMVHEVQLKRPMGVHAIYRSRYGEDGSLV
jgi:hypothetical protein